MSKNLFIISVSLILLLTAGCALNTFSPQAQQATKNTNIVKTLVASALTSQPQEPTPTPFQPTYPTATAILTATPEIIPSSTPIPVYDETRSLIFSLMEGYGLIQDYYLSDAYWDRLINRVNNYGVARNILTLELHGNNYDMYNGGYSLTPQAFHEQVDYLMANDYHFATVHEIEGFVYGWLELPARSVILTTDLSSQTVHSLYSITGTFAELTDKYGYQPHMVGFIWTGDMHTREGIACDQNSCWQALAEANSSGFHTFGSHSTTHRDFGTLSEQASIEDIQTSITAIEENLGIKVYSLAWPFETCSPYAQAFVQFGISLAWGGSTKPLDINFTARNDPRPLCLPRLFPPNPTGVSMRPPGMTLEDMLQSALSAP